MNVASERKKSDNTVSDEISAEEIGKILNEAAGELEKDAQKALKGLEEDKEIMKRLQEVKQRRKESASDVNKGNEMFRGAGNVQNMKPQASIGKLFSLFLIQTYVLGTQNTQKKTKCFLDFKG